MNTPGGAFQQAFAEALFDPSQAVHPAVRALAMQPAFAVYRNTVMKACIDALQANFPTVAQLVGEEWFRAAAALYVTADIPRDGRLLHYGGGFPDFLRGFEPAAELVYPGSQSSTSFGAKPMPHRMHRPPTRHGSRSAPPNKSPAWRSLHIRPHVGPGSMRSRSTASGSAIAGSVIWATSWTGGAKVHC